jgi:hypothetical protein
MTTLEFITAIAVGTSIGFVAGIILAVTIYWTVAGLVWAGSKTLDLIGDAILAATNKIDHAKEQK